MVGLKEEGLVQLILGTVKEIYWSRDNKHRGNVAVPNLSIMCNGLLLSFYRPRDEMLLRLLASKKYTTGEREREITK